MRSAGQLIGVDVFWGVVDGNCDMRSTGDVVVTGKLALSQPRAAVRLPQPPALLLAATAAALALVLAARRRRE